MSFLKRHANQDEPESSGDNEELYERLFSKIGRDFVTRDDFVFIMNQIMMILDPFGLIPIDLSHKQGAMKLASAYKQLLKSGKDGSKIYKDLINLDD